VSLSDADVPRKNARRRFVARGAFKRLPESPGKARAIPVCPTRSPRRDSSATSCSAGTAARRRRPAQTCRRDDPRESRCRWSSC